MIKLAKKAVLLAIMLIFGMIGVTGCIPWALGETSSVWTMMVESGLNEERTLTTWEITANSLRGNGRRDISLTAEQLAAFHVQSGMTSGTVSLTLTQGETLQTWELSNGSDENIGNFLTLDAFLPGQIRLELNFDRTENVNVYVDWTE